MAIRFSTVALTCDFPGCDLTEVMEVPEREHAYSQPRLYIRTGRDWALDRPVTYHNDNPGRQDFCPDHREEAHKTRRGLS